jgi:hypothetical protein
MTDISITAANVRAGSDAVIESGTAGATITAGQQVYLDTADSKYKLADNNSATVAARSPRGTALHGASDGQPLDIQKAGDITIGGTLTAGVAYYLSGTAGAICPVADLTTGMYSTFLGIARSTTVLRYRPVESGVAL